MSSVKILLLRPSAYSGLGLIATTSALAGPLCLEVIYNHADLWFNGRWQDHAFSIVWLIWTLLGVIITTSWGLDRGFHGIKEDIHLKYSLILSVIGILTYVVFSIPTCVWLTQMTLINAWALINKVMISLGLLCLSNVMACVIERLFNSIVALMLSTFFALWGTYSLWSYLGFGVDG